MVGGCKEGGFLDFGGRQKAVMASRTLVLQKQDSLLGFSKVIIEGLIQKRKNQTLGLLEVYLTLESRPPPKRGHRHL